jgi:hypothetical protein
MRFRLVIRDTNSDNKYDADSCYEFLGDKESIMFLWIQFKKMGKNHVEVFSLDGTKQEPEKGVNGLCDSGV